MQVYCPYCNSLNNLKTVCTDCKKSTMSSYTDKCNYNRIKNSTAIVSNVNQHYSMNYDGTAVKRKSYDRYCMNCHKPFYYLSNLIVGDIVRLTFIIDSNSDRWKYEIIFVEDNSYYNVEHNYFTKECESILTPARKRKIQYGIDKSRLLNWEPLKEKNYFNYNIKWNIYILFNNEQTYSRGGYDEYPENWEIFIEPFIRVFKNNIFKKMKRV